MESVISYPPSTVSPLYNSSTLTTPGTAKTKDGTNVFFATHLSPASTTNDAADGKYVSSASVMMNDTHSSSEGDFDNDHIIKLVFSDLPGDIKRTSAKKVEVLEQRPQEVIESMEESCQTPNSSVDSEGGNVRAVLIINPHNPLGIVFPPDEVIRLCDWATRNDLVVLVDESFATCVFGSTNFSSFLTYRHRLKKPENVFYLWSLSKDFGIPGMKISVVQSSSPKLLQSLRRLELIHPVSALAHDAASALLSDFGTIFTC
ncbi:hypothetical protein GCK32_008089 [Trichostrongylus colubriformis]|uniref:Aminotransferase class I/classII large domain-containing protein n=1 Tax=Trichostrongylus colubriformis TaxID=6319 RepID=A0AAN8EV07_TRICO